MKAFNEMQNIGSAKYVVNHHDGVKQHRDGSSFFDIAIFSSKRKKDAFVKDLRRSGYVESFRFA